MELPEIQKYLFDSSAKKPQKFSKELQKWKNEIFKFLLIYKKNVGLKKLPEST